MSRTLLMIVVGVVGSGFALQSPINGALGRDVGGLQAAAVSFTAGSVVLIAVCLTVGGGFGRIGDHPVPWHYVAGGLLGAAIVSTALLTVERLGTASLVGAMITGQLLVAAIVDHFGWLGVARSPVTPLRLAGLALLAAGIVLVAKGRTHPEAKASTTDAGRVVRSSIDADPSATHAHGSGAATVRSRTSAHERSPT